MQGRVMWRRDKVNTASITIPVSMLASGIYFINVKDNEHSKVLKLLKE